MRGALLLLLLAAPGCAHNYLERNTLKTAGTLSSLQSQQVMDNLARLCANPKANPTHVTLSSGLVQVADQGTGALASTLQTNVATIFTPAVSVQRGLVEQWTVAPIVDGGTLETLQVAYRKALDPSSEDVDNEIRGQIVDLCVRYTLLPSEGTLGDLLHEKKAQKAIFELCKALNHDNQNWQEIADVAKANMADAKGKDKFDLFLKKKEIETEIAARTEQIKLLCHLGGLNAAHISTEMKEAESNVRKGAKTKRDKAKETFDRKPGTQSAASSRRQPKQGTQSSTTSDTTLLILTALQTKSPAGYLPPTDLMWESVRNPALVDQAEDQISNLEILLKEFQTPWLCCSNRCKDVPTCACAVGHAKVCGQDCYVWVMPGDFDKLQEFTRIIMTLTASAQQDIPPPSPAFSPTLVR